MSASKPEHFPFDSVPVRLHSCLKCGKILDQIEKSILHVLLLSVNFSLNIQIYSDASWYFQFRFDHWCIPAWGWDFALKAHSWHSWHRWSGARNRKPPRFGAQLWNVTLWGFPSSWGYPKAIQGPKAWMMYKKVRNLYWNFPQIDDLGVPSL